ncbi:MAG: hypothetical protein A3J54_00330 [Candidatus Ryanbacteria bacterium RIFCSPHIGHO2_02_FULL_45_13b]|uniref:MSP domain-containing protein n=1 Tax=Candidatus Ryanbacteria bacterium RIFCSPHIGHO2_02_FULL_45_13b TaxID=1802117 RepID=A0A1G2G4S4_9BACT|nr:MAG: hypothetical protein A3J54_00330 [Candidatus Ryanbacteria bacterium RIFCSPHIGHO2_02_FULL_45_13b]
MDEEIKKEESDAEHKKTEKLTFMEKVFACFSLFVFLFIFYVTLDANKYEAQVRAMEGEGRVGVNPTSERLDFGDLSRGTAAVRTVTVTNDTFIPFFVSVVRVGAISNLMDVEPNNFILRKDTEERIEFTTYMPASAEVDHMYTGRVFVFKIPVPFL